MCHHTWDSGICGIIAATDIASKSGYDEWACDTSGYTLTDPCAGPWTGITCTAGAVDKVDLNSKGISGRQFILCGIIYSALYMVLLCHSLLCTLTCYVMSYKVLLCEV